MQALSGIPIDVHLVHPAQQTQQHPQLLQQRLSLQQEANLDQWLDNAFQTRLPLLEEELYQRLTQRIYSHSTVPDPAASEQPETFKSEVLAVLTAPSSVPKRIGAHANGSIQYQGAGSAVSGTRSSDRKYKLAESVWDTMLLAWTPMVGCGSSLFMTLAMVANVAVQLLCGYIAFNSLSKKGNFSANQAITDAQNYRLTEAHNPDRMDKVGWVSLAHRVCDKDGSLVFGAAQVAQLKEIEGYMQDVGLGKDYGMGCVLVTACLVFFFLSIANEMLDCWRFLEAVVGLPWRFHRTCLVNVDGQVTMVFISSWRLALVMLMVIARMLVAVLLLYGGGLWLSKTSQLEALLLNCAALAFVLELDELLFKTCIPCLAKQVMSKFAPLRLRPEREVRGLGWRPVAVFFACVVYISCMVTLVVQRMQVRMVDVRKEMCQANHDFVADQNLFSGYGIVVPTQSSSAEVHHTLLRHCTKEFSSPANVYGQDWSSADKLHEFAKNFMSDVNSEQSGKYNSSCTVAFSQQLFKQLLQVPGMPFARVTCSDALHVWKNKTDVLKWAIRYVTSNMTAETCQDVSMNCSRRFGQSHDAVGRIVRSLCSKTCGCPTFEPSKSIITKSGCNPGCNADRTASLLQHSCKDKEVAEVVAKTRVYLQAFASYHQLKMDQVVKTINVSRGCDGLRQASASDNPDVTELADLLCGRAGNSSKSLRDVPYVTMRWLCPESCGCGPAKAEGCPLSCRLAATNKTS